MLIRAYGQFSNPDTVDWGKRGRGQSGKPLGSVRRKGKQLKIDFWNAKGIYVLHANFKAVYVGKTDATKLGPRLRSHLTDRFAGRWDMFSWFATSTLAATRGGVRKPGKRQVEPGTVINTLEALAILIADPALNRKRETIPKASAWQGKVRLRIGRKHDSSILHGSRGRTRIVDLNPAEAARIVAQLGVPIAKTLARRAT